MYINAVCFLLLYRLRKTSVARQIQTQPITIHSYTASPTCPLPGVQEFQTPEVHQISRCSSNQRSSSSPPCSLQRMRFQAANRRNTRSANRPFSPVSQPRSGAGPNSNALQRTSRPTTGKSTNKSATNSQRRNFSVISFGNLFPPPQHGNAPLPCTKTWIAAVSTLRRAACLPPKRMPRAMMGFVISTLMPDRTKASGVSDSSANAPSSTAAHFPRVTRCSKDGE